MYGPKHYKIVHFNGEVPSGSGYIFIGLLLLITPQAVTLLQLPKLLSRFETGSDCYCLLNTTIP